MNQQQTSNPPTSSTPQDFPDQSVGGHSQQYNDIFDDVFTGKNVNKALKSATGAGIKLIPVVGGLLSGLLSALWPDPTHKGLVWEDIEGKVKALALELIDENNSKYMRNMTEGLHDLMKDYLEQEPGSIEKGEHFTCLLSALTKAKPFYCEDSAPWNNLAYFANVGTIHLSVLREQYLFYDRIYGRKDPIPEKHMKDLEDAVKGYLYTRDRIVQTCLKHHKEQITVEWDEKDVGYYDINSVNLKNPDRNVDERFRWEDPGYLLDRHRFHCRQKQFEAWINTGYRSQIEAILSPTFSWPLYSSAPKAGLAKEDLRAKSLGPQIYPDVDEGQVNDTTVRRFMMDCPGWMGDGATDELWGPDLYFDHEDAYRQYGTITKVILHAGDMLNGIEVWYGGQGVKMCGNRTGSQHKTLELQPGEMITGLWAEASDEGKGSLTGLKLLTTLENGEIGQAVEVLGAKGQSLWTLFAGEQWKLSWTYSFDGHKGGLNGDEVKRLLWFTGFSFNLTTEPLIFRLQPIFGHYQTWGPLQ